jgi:hypothetical protein
MTNVCRASIATGYWLDDRGFGVHIPVGLRIFVPPPPMAKTGSKAEPSIVSTGHYGLLPRRQSGKSVKLIIHPQLVLGPRKHRSIRALPHHHHTAVLI